MSTNVNNNNTEQAPVVDDEQPAQERPDTSDEVVHVLRSVAGEDLSSIRLGDEARRTLLNQSAGLTVSQMVDRIRGNGDTRAGGLGGEGSGVDPGAPQAPGPDH